MCDRGVAVRHAGVQPALGVTDRLEIRWARQIRRQTAPPAKRLRRGEKPRLELAARQCDQKARILANSLRPRQKLRTHLGRAFVITVQKDQHQSSIGDSLEGRQLDIATEVLGILKERTRLDPDRRVDPERRGRTKRFREAAQKRRKRLHLSMAFDDRRDEGQETSDAPEFEEVQLTLVVDVGYGRGVRGQLVQPQ
jgi:hypothetical protein